MPLPTTQVDFHVFLDNGQPDAGAHVRFKLDHWDTDPDFGYVEPKEIVGVTGPDGSGSVQVWPNERGTQSSRYNVTVDGTDQSESFTALVPTNGPVDLRFIASLPPYPPISISESAAAAAAASAAAAEASAAAAAASATDAAGSVDAVVAAKDAAVAAQVAAEGSATQAADSALQAQQAAATAAADAVAAAQPALDASVQAAAGSAAAALTSEQNAHASELATAGSAQAALTSEQNAHASELATAGSAQAALTSEQNAHASELATAGSATAAATSEQNAHDSELAAAVSAGESSSSATQAGEYKDETSSLVDTALGYLGEMTLATAIMLGYVNTATGAADLAKAYAAQTASVAQQDLSGVVSVPLYRSPNAVLGSFTYDTSKDKDGGAWIDTAIAQSWANEPLNGAYLPHSDAGGWQNEFHARAYNATLGAELFAGVWTTLGAGTTYVNGVLNVPNYPTSGTSIAQANTLLTANRAYLVTYTITAINGFISSLGASYSGPIRSAPGTYTEFMSSTGALFGFQSRNTGVTSATITGISVKQIVAYTTASGAYFQLATDGKYYKLNKNLVPWSENGFANWSKTGVATIVPSAGTIDGIAAESINTNAAGAGPFRSSIVSQVLGAGEVYSVQVRLKHVNGDSTTRVRLEGTAFTSPVGIALNPVDGTWAVSTGTAPTNVVVNPTTDGGWFLSFSGATQSAGAVNVSVYSQNAAARTVLATAVQLERGPATTYEPKLTADLGITETWAGNKAKFPRLPHIVWEAANATMFDLDEPGRPMWRRFLAPAVSSGAATSGAITASVAGSITSITAGNGKMIVCRAGDTSNVHGANEIDFIRDSSNWYAKYTGASFGALVGGGTGCRIRGNIADRNVLRPTQPDAAFGIASGGGVNAAAMTWLPNAPIDQSTNLPVPTIALAIGSGSAGVLGSVIMNDGSIVAYSQSANDGAQVAFTSRGEIVWTGSISTVIAVWPLQTANVSNVLTQTPGVGARFYNISGSSGIPALVLPGTRRYAIPAGPVLYSYTQNNVINGLPGVSMQRENPTLQGAGLVANITGGYTTGLMVGDTRRVILSGLDMGLMDSTVSLVTNGVNLVNTNGWGTINNATLSAVNGALRVANDGVNGQGRSSQAIATIPGHSYVMKADTLATGNTVGTFSASPVNNGGGILVNSAQVPTAFTAVSNPTYIFMNVGVGTAGMFADFNNISVYEIVPDRSYRNSYAIAVGAINRTPVAAAAQLVGWSGFTGNTLPLYGVETVVNGAFAADISSWNTAWAGGNVAWVPTNGGSARIYGNGIAAYSRLSQTVATIPGLKYRLSFDIYAFPVSVDLSINTTPPPSADVGGEIMPRTQFNPGLGQHVDFTAVSAYTCVNFWKLEVDQAFVDNVSIKQTSFNANFVQEAAFSADLDVGAGAWRGSAWVNIANTAFGPGNFIPRSAWTGAVNGAIGAGGSLPPGMSITGQLPGLTTTLTKSTDAVSGFEVLDIRLAGNATAGGIIWFYFAGTPTNIAAATGQTWTTSVYSSLQAGSMANIANVSLYLEETEGGNWVANSVVPVNLGAGAINTQRTVLTRTFNGGSTVNMVRPDIGVTLAAAGPVDLTLRLAVPQLERGTTAGLPIATTGTAYNGIAPIFHRGGAAGASYRFGIDANGMLAAEIVDSAATVRRATSNSPINTGVWNKGVVEYDGAGTISLRLNAQPVGSATGAALTTVNNAVALMTYGNNFAMTAAFPGSMALVNVGATLMGTNAEVWAYELERQMFKPGAQIAIADTGNILAAPYDDREGKLKVITAANEASFNGLVRTSNTPVGAGSFTGGSHQSSIKTLIRTTQNPGVDITIPAQNLKEELQRRAEEAQRALHIMPQVFNFDAVANQTDFTLPVGWETVSVAAARSAQREGTTKDYVRKFDGFKETVSFAVGQAAATWVQVTARRAA